MSIGDSIEETWRQEQAERDAWDGDYDGTTCANCGRERVLKCGNGRRRCEKCNWDQEAKEYAPYDNR